MYGLFESRLRRVRNNVTLRTMLEEHNITADHLIYPLFVEECATEPADIASMPGIKRIPEAMLAEEVRATYADGVKAIVLFGVSHHKDEVGGDALSADGLLARMVRQAKTAEPRMIVIADLCFCEYTTHGHCGVITNGVVDNDTTIANLACQAVVAANAGADIVAPSAMMDGQVAAIRAALDEAGHGQIPILSYSTKFASALYGPFREAAGSQLVGDRASYQLTPSNAREALRESDVDETEGADMLMVKPGLCYLDVLSALRQRTMLPIAAFQVSGEYAMIKFAARAGAIDEKLVVRETLIAFRRAGADLIITYFARGFARGEYRL